MLPDDDHPGPRCSCSDCLLTYRADELLDRLEHDSAPLLSITSYERIRIIEKKPSTPVDPMLVNVASALQKLAGSDRIPDRMNMLPNDHHPGPRCSCGDCLRTYP